MSTCPFPHTGKFLTLRDSSRGEFNCAGFRPRNVHETPTEPWSAIGDPSPRQTSIGKISDSVMKSERGVLVRGSDPPSGHSSPHTRAGWFSRKRNGIHPSGMCVLPTKNKTLSRGQLDNVVYTPHGETTRALANIPARQHHREGSGRRKNRNGPWARSKSEKLVFLV